MKYTLEDGIRLCRELEPAFREIGMHIGLTGSLMYRGASEKDIDIVVYPHDTSILRSLKKAATRNLLDLGFVEIKPDKGKYYGCSGHIFITKAPNGSRVDFFFMRQW
jgi:hypothetical protein